MDSKPIRDPVHDYIFLTPIELSIIDTPEFQRLRFIFQNSTAFLTYPGSTNTRFLHSLGAMHLGGQLLINGFENTRSEVLSRFIVVVDNILLEYGNDIEVSPDVIAQEWKSTVGNASHFEHSPQSGSKLEFEALSTQAGLRSSGGGSNQYDIKDNTGNSVTINHNPLLIINALWQAIRLCGLVHDVGHLPMSHLFEDAIREFREERIGKDAANIFQSQEIISRKKKYLKKLHMENENEFLCRPKIPHHEMLGLFLTWKMYPDQNSFDKIVFKLAKEILLFDPDRNEPEEPEKNKILRCLHAIIASELDADRLDYGLRDPYSSGLELGAVDVRRIVDNMILSDVDAEFRIVPTDKALSALESFFHQRYLVYKYLIYHHSVVRMDGVIKEIIIQLLELAYDGNDEHREVRDVLDNFGFVTYGVDDDGCRFLPDALIPIIDDAWLRTLLAAVFIQLNNKYEIPSKTPIWARNLKVLIDTFLFRKADNLISAWKRDTDYGQTFVGIATAMNVNEEDVAKLFPLTLRKKNIGIKGSQFKTFLRALREELEPDIIVLYRHTKPKICEEAEDGTPACVVCLGDGYTSAWKASPYIASLKDVSENLPDVQIAFLADGLKGNDALAAKCNSSLITCLITYVETLRAAALA